MARIRHTPGSTRTSTRQGFLGRALGAMIGARERQARHQMTMHLLALDDASLAQLGYDRESLKADAPQTLF